MKVLVTLDYELFNGKEGGTVTNCLINPMDAFLSTIDKHNVKITVFVDACFLLRLKELKEDDHNIKGDWEKVTENLRQLAETGHSIQLHLHPQWLKAKAIDGRWYSDLSLYKLSDLTEAESLELFKKGCTIIEEVTGIKPVAFRAGDYCAQTFKGLPQALRENGIIIDSSVLRGKSSKNEREWFDYSKIPDEYFYKFNNSVDVKDEEGIFLEISIPTYPHSLTEIYYRKKKVGRLGEITKSWGDGTSSTGTQLMSSREKVLHILHMLTKSNRMSASVDGISATFLDEIYRLERKKKSPYMLIMGHPKTFTPYYLDLFDSFLDRVEKDDQVCTIDKLLQQ